MERVDSTLCVLQTRPGGLRPHRFAVAIIYCAVITLAILNPLLCLLHCAFSHRHVTLTSEQGHFLCDLGRVKPGLISEPFTAAWSGPRALYQSLPLPALALLLVVILVTGISVPAARMRSHIPQPESPPPKVQLLLSLR